MTDIEKLNHYKQLIKSWKHELSQHDSSQCRPNNCLCVALNLKIDMMSALISGAEKSLKEDVQTTLF